jgi:hypothetical protein
MENGYYVSVSKNYKICGGYQIPQSVETGNRPDSSTKYDIKCSATNMFLSFDMLVPMISLLSISIAA